MNKHETEKKQIPWNIEVKKNNKNKNQPISIWEKFSQSLYQTYNFHENQCENLIFKWKSTQYSGNPSTEMNQRANLFVALPMGRRKNGELEKEAGR